MMKTPMRKQPTRMPQQTRARQDGNSSVETLPTGHGRIPFDGIVARHCLHRIEIGCTDEYLDLNGQLCLVGQGDLASDWCTTPNPTKERVCGGELCGVRDSNDDCDFMPTGRHHLEAICPGSPKSQRSEIQAVTFRNHPSDASRAAC